jgi:hypothetical protein
MVISRVSSQSTTPIASTFLSRHHSPRLDAFNPSLMRATKRKTRSLHFQSLAHSSQFTIDVIASIFLALRTLCKKHRGGGVALLFLTKIFIFSKSPLTPIESHCFTNVPSKPFRMIFFRKTWGQGQRNIQFLPLVTRRPGLPLSPLPPLPPLPRHSYLAVCATLKLP